MQKFTKIVQPILNMCQIYYEFIMFKKSTDVLKKSTKPLMVISTIATLLIAAIGSMPVMNSSASDYILISNDNNSGSIETHSLYNCVGEGKTCVNTNQNNNKEIADNGEVSPPPSP